MRTSHVLFATISILILSLSGCAKKPEKPIIIAINPWPGYEFLYLAEEKGFFEQAGINIQLIQLDSLSDAQRAYINNHADGIASTLIEAVQVGPLGGKPVSIVMITDYSNGGDVIISQKNIQTIADLKGKKVGAEVSSLGIYVLQRALVQAGMSLNDVTLVNTGQHHGEQAMTELKIDAFVSYPPVSVNLLKHPQLHTLFTSADIPKEIIDTVALSKAVIQQHPKLVSGLHQAWQLALNFYQQYPDEAVNIMAKREGLTPAEFKIALGDLVILDSSEQQALLQQADQLQQAAVNVCKSLVHVQSLDTNCEALPDIVYRGAF
jgi:NitT/TauT family transport system substrate-binding protein